MLINWKATTEVWQTAIPESALSWILVGLHNIGLLVGFVLFICLFVYLFIYLFIFKRDYTSEKLSCVQVVQRILKKR